MFLCLSSFKRQISRSADDGTPYNIGFKSITLIIIIYLDTPMENVWCSAVYYFYYSGLAGPFLDPTVLSHLLIHTSILFLADPISIFKQS